MTLVFEPIYCTLPQSLPLLPSGESRPCPTSFQTIKSLQPFIDGAVNSSTYASILESCKCPRLGNQLHAHCLKNGYDGHKFVETKLLQMYGRCGCLRDAALLFDKMPLRNIHSWTAVIHVYLDTGFFEEALALFQELLLKNVELQFFVFPLVLKICCGLGGVELGRQLHGIVTKLGFVANIYVGNALIDMYGKCGSLDNAKNIFNTMPERDRVSWNSILTACATNGVVYDALNVLERMLLSESSKPDVISWSAVIGGFSQTGYDEEAIEMLDRMQVSGFKPNAQTMASVLPACARLQALHLGKEIHGYIIRHEFLFNPFVVNGLVDVYRRCADMESAHKIFSKFSLKNAVSFNTMILGYCENGELFKAKELFDQMELLGIRDKISWNLMISGYVDNGLLHEALSMFVDLLGEEEILADSFTMGSILNAYADKRSLRQGKSIHSQVIIRGLQSNPFVGGSLVEMYGKGQDLKAAQSTFNEVIERDTATWNALISAFAHGNQIESVRKSLQKMVEDGFEPNVYTWNGIITGHIENGCYESAVQLFIEMQESNMKPDVYTVGMILSVCSRLATIERGKQVHAHSMRHGYDRDAYTGAALVDMYAKCGSFKHAQMAYNRIRSHNLVTRNSMLAAYAMHGHGEEGIDFFLKMLLDGFRPDNVTFLSVLSSCIHAGSVKSGQEFFNLMNYYNVRRTLKHYTCLVDLLSRAGQLNEAFEVIKQMPVQPDSVIWGALLGGCIIFSDIHLGEIAAEKLLELEPDNMGNYVMVANLYASASRWCDLARTRQMIKEKQMQKKPGCSWIEDKQEIHVFVAWDTSHERAEEIYATLDHLTHQIRMEQY